ncbi:hypothetical protein ACLBUR_08070, partial [Pseudomonas aeruginosa]
RLPLRADPPDARPAWHRAWGKRQGARDYLTKPVDEETLLKTINAVLAG